MAVSLVVAVTSILRFCYFDIVIFIPQRFVNLGPEYWGTMYGVVDGMHAAWGLSPSSCALYTRYYCMHRV